MDVEFIVLSIVSIVLFCFAVAVVAHVFLTWKD